MQNAKIIIRSFFSLFIIIIIVVVVVVLYPQNGIY